MIFLIITYPCIIGMFPVSIPSGLLFLNMEVNLFYFYQWAKLLNIFSSTSLSFWKTCICSITVFKIIWHNVFLN